MQSTFPPFMPRAVPAGLIAQAILAVGEREREVYAARNISLPEVSFAITLPMTAYREVAQ